MALDAAHRSSIFEKLRPILGDEDANALMSQFPAIEAQELVTKDFLRAELAELRTELRGEMNELRTELRGEMNELRTELRGEMNELRTELRGEMNELRTEMGGLRGEMGGLRGEMGGLRGEMAAIETRLTIRLGAGLAASTSLLVAIGLLT